LTLIAEESRIQMYDNTDQNDVRIGPNQLTFFILS
jgi:hypothetical protein